jgi:hypothetical protein
MGSKGSQDPWQAFAVVAGMAALVGAGVGAGTALTWSERRVGRMHDAVESLERRVAVVEALTDRVRRLEAGGGPGHRAPEPPAGA